MREFQGLLPGRRGFLAGAAGLAALPFAGRHAFAADQMVISTWGGDYANLLKANVDDPLMKPQGITVVQDTNDEDPRVAKMYAQRHLPRGSWDVVSVQGVRANEVMQSGLVEKLTTAEVPNLAHTLPILANDYYAVHIYSPQVLVYNPDKVKEPPKTFTDLLDPKYKGRVGVGNINYFYVMMAAALAATGDLNKVDTDAAKALAVKLNGNGLRLYPSTDSIGAGLKSGEIDVGVMWLARVIMWQNAGIPVQAQFPTEGCVLYTSDMVVPKNAPNKPAAYKYLNAILEPSAQQGFAEKMGYLPTVNNATLTGKVAQQLALPNPGPKMTAPDYTVVGKLQTPISDWWKKTIQGG